MSKTKESKLISLSEAEKYCSYSADYLKLRARQGKLKAEKIGRIWVTTKEWVKDYVQEMDVYKKEKTEGKIEKPELKIPKLQFRVPVLSPVFIKTIPVALIVALVITGIAFGKDTFYPLYNRAYKQAVAAVEQAAESIIQRTESITNVLEDASETMVAVVEDITQSIVHDGTEVSRDFIFALQNLIAVSTQEVFQVAIDTFEEYNQRVLKMASRISANSSTNFLNIKISLRNGILISSKYLVSSIKSTASDIQHQTSDGIDVLQAKISGLQSGLQTSAQEYIEKWRHARTDLAVNITESLRNSVLSVKQSLTRLFGRKQFVVISLTQEEIDAQIDVQNKEIESLKQELEKIAQEKFVERIITKEIQVSRITKIEPIKEIEKIEQITKIDEQELFNVKGDVSDVRDDISSVQATLSSWESDIEELQLITQKLQSRPQNVSAPTAPIYIASQGLQVGGTGIFDSLGVSGSGSFGNLSVGGSTSLGIASDDYLTVNANSTFLGTMTVDSITDGTATLTGGALTGLTTALSFGQGGTGLTTALDDTVMVSSSSAWVAKAIADCDDGSGHLNYDTTTNAFSCGTTDDDLPDADEIVESMLKAIDAAGDEECLTFETGGGGDFEWQVCGGSTAWDDIGNPDADDAIALAGFEVGWSSTLDEAGHVAIKLDHTDADVTAATTLFQIQSVDDADADLTYFRIIDDSGAAPNTVFSIGADGVTAMDAGITSGGTIEGATITEGGIAVLNNNEIDASAELLAIMDDETGTGALTFATAPTFTTSISVGSAGVSLSDDGDGALTFLGLGDGADEDFTINLDDTANTAVITSSTLLDKFDFGTINIDAGTVTATFVGNITGAVTGNADTATALAANPNDCAANTFADAIDASGHLTCNGVVDADVANDITINSTAVITSAVGIDAIGNVDFDIGSADVDDVTIITDGGTWILDDTFTFPDANVAPNAVGELVYDNTVAGIDDGLFSWYDDDEVRYLVDIITLPGDPEDDYVVAYDKDIDEFYMKQDTVGGGAATAYDDIGDPDAATTIVFDDDEKVLWQTAQDTAGSFFTIDDTDAAVGNAVYLLELQHSDDGEANASFFKATDNNGDVKFSIDNEGVTTIGSGTALSLIIGDNTNALDYQIKFDGNAADGLITWDEDNDVFLTDNITATTFTGALTGQADTVATITGLAPDTATTQAAQAAITSVGTLTSLTLSGDVLFTQADPEILGGDTDGVLIVAADTVNNQGGSVRLYGNTHATEAQDIEFYADATMVLSWDESEGNWDFDAEDIVGIGSATATTFVGALTGNASTATALAANPNDCAANTFADAIDANGNLTCNGVVDADVANDITINSTALITSAVGIDAIGAVDFDIGSVDVTDVTVLTDGGTVILDGTATLSTATALALVIGDNTDGVDFQIKFDGNANDGLITWMEDEDLFAMDDISVTKITTDAIDPLYHIGDEHYSTYMASIVGSIKEEIVDVIELQQTPNSDLFIYVIDFNNLEKDSDLWLFNQVVELGSDMEELVVLLSSEQGARVSYKKDPENNRLIIYGNQQCEVSYRLTALRFDYEKWPTISDQTVGGIVVPDRDSDLGFNSNGMIDSEEYTELAELLNDSDIYTDFTDFLASLGASIQDSILTFQELIVERLFAKKLETNTLVVQESLIVRSSNGSCFQVTVSDNGLLNSVPINCESQELLDLGMNNNANYNAPAVFDAPAVTENPVQDQEQEQAIEPVEENQETSEPLIEQVVEEPVLEETEADEENSLPGNFGSISENGSQEIEEQIENELLDIPLDELIEQVELQEEPEATEETEIVE